MKLEYITIGILLLIILGMSSAAEPAQEQVFVLATEEPTAFNAAAVNTFWIPSCGAGGPVHWEQIATVDSLQAFKNAGYSNISSKYQDGVLILAGDCNNALV